MKYILLVAIIALTSAAFIKLHSKEMKCRSFTGSVSEAVSDHAFIINHFSVGDTVPLVSFRNLKSGYKESWSINTGYRRSDTVYSTHFDMGKLVSEPIWVADQTQLAIVVAK